MAAFAIAFAIAMTQHLHLTTVVDIAAIDLRSVSAAVIDAVDAAVATVSAID